MKISTKVALANALLGMADDELVLAHRNSEWIGHAPILEEDIALANIAQDELGHAMVWYTLHQQLTDGDTPDQLVYFREADQYRNVQMMEQPRGDWAFTFLRQYLFDAYEQVLLSHLSQCSYQPIVDPAAKIKQEELYHYRHSALWVQRLGLGTEESHFRMQRALEQLWPLAMQLFVPVEQNQLLADEGFFPELLEMERAWQAMVMAHLTSANLQTTANSDFITMPRTAHSHHLTELLGDLQQVARVDPEAEW